MFFLLATINVVRANDDKFSIGLSLSNNQVEQMSASNIDSGFKLDFGYSINDILSVELSYFKLGDIDFGSTQREPTVSEVESKLIQITSLGIKYMF